MDSVVVRRVQLTICWTDSNCDWLISSDMGDLEFEIDGNTTKKDGWIERTSC